MCSVRIDFTVRQKLAALLMTVTVAEDLDRLRALVKRVHMTALQMKMSAKHVVLTATTTYVSHEDVDQ